MLPNKKLAIRKASSDEAGFQLNDSLLKVKEQEPFAGLL